MPKKILLDCDPGLDAALALLLAHGDPNIELVGVTTVGGNVGLPQTTRNALALREYLHFEKVVVAAGASEPLSGEVRSAIQVHGESGLGNAALPEPILAVDDRHAVDFIIETVRASPGAIHLVATGPLTNIALALQKEPAIARLVASFTIMGGSFTRGNATPAAEFNIYADPAAARMVFDADWQVVMVGLDLTLQATANGPVVERLGRLGVLSHELILPLATFWAGENKSGENKSGANQSGANQSGVNQSGVNQFDAHNSNGDGQAVHDVCAVAHVARPDLFASRPARVQVETTGEFTSGMTVVDFDSPFPNAIVPVTLDVAGFWAYVERVYSIVAEQHA